jgi:Trk K+ transport system NAD-binding subunit
MTPPVLLCGLGQVGHRVLEYLRALGIPVVVVDAECQPGDPRLGECRLVRGDFRRRETLEAAGVATCRGILILGSDDLVNVSAALTARSLHPEVRIVVRMFNQNLLQRLGQTVRNIVALSTSALTAPMIALTALTGDALGTFELADGRRQVAETVVGERSSLVGLTIDEVATTQQAVVVAHLPAPGTPRYLHEVEPATRLAAGDRLVLCGRPRQIARLLAEDHDAFPVLRWAGALRRLGRALLRAVGEIDLPVKIAATILFVVVGTSTLVYHVGVGKTLGAGFFRSISVIATGADMHEEELTEDWQKVFVSVLRLSGAALLAGFTAILTNYLVRAQLGGALEVRRIPEGGHVLVCGLGNVGFRVVEELLRHGEPVVAIERSRESRFLATTRRLGAAVIVGDATVLEVLRQAHAGTARAVVAATSNELANLEIALLARELNPKQRVVVRVTDPQLAATLRHEANVGLALSVPELAASAFVAALYGDRVHSVFLVQGRMFAVIELVVEPGEDYLEGRLVRPMVVDYGMTPVELRAAHGALRAQPLNHRLTAGDRLTVLAAMTDLERFLRRERPPAEYGVEVTGFALPARPLVEELLRSRRGLTGEALARAVATLPVRVAEGLTRGEAEEMLHTLKRDGIKARLATT